LQGTILSHLTCNGKQASNVITHEGQTCASSPLMCHHRYYLSFPLTLASLQWWQVLDVVVVDEVVDDDGDVGAICDGGGWACEGDG